MNATRRQILKMLPMAALTGAAVSVGNAQGEMMEVRPDKKYIFRINNSHDFTQKELDSLKDKLIANGYPEGTVVIAGDVDVFEV